MCFVMHTVENPRDYVFAPSLWLHLTLFAIHNLQYTLRCTGALSASSLHIVRKRQYYLQGHFQPC
jgi:hypothetical protein